MSTQLGLLSPADIVTILDACGGYLKSSLPHHGQGLASESSTNTEAYQALLMQTLIMGDGGAVPGIGNSGFQASVKQILDGTFVSSRWEAYAGTNLRQIFGMVTSNLTQNVPKYLSSTGVLTSWSMGSQPLDAWLIRHNANNSLTPATPTGTPTLTPSTGGSLPGNSTAGNCPSMVYTFVGTEDKYESQPSAPSTQVALTGVNNAYTIGGLATIPAGVTKIRIYRSLYGSVSPYYYDRDVAVTVGTPPTTLKFTAPDINLNQNVKPPVWNQCLSLMEDALAHSTSNMSQGDTIQKPYTISATGLLTASNVVLGAANGILGYSNPISSGRFYEWASTVATLTSVNTTSDTTQGLQGFAGATQLQARTFSTLDANASISAIGYTYTTAASPNTPLSGTISGPLTLNLAVGSVVSLAIPANRLVKTITSVTVSGATTGSFVIEGVAPRTI